MRPRFLFLAAVTALTFSPGLSLARQNLPPAQPTVTEPAFDGRIVNASDVHMESSLFSDPNPSDQHLCSDWEVWTIEPSERVWATECIGGVERIHTHIGDGFFENSHEGRSTFFPDTNYRLRVRHRDNSGALNSWGPWGERLFTTAPPTQINPMELMDVASTPVPTWRYGEQSIILGGADPAAYLAIETGGGEILLQIQSLYGSGNQVIDFPMLDHHHPLRVRINAGGLPNGLVIPESSLRFTADDGQARTIYLPVVALTPGAEATFWVAASGATYVGDASQQDPDFTTLARSAPVPWAVHDGYRVEVVAGGFSLPVNIAFVPDPLPESDAPFFYVTELYGTIKVVYRDGSVHNFATNLLNFPPTGNFPGSGEQGLTGLAIEPGTNTVYVSMLYETAAGFHFPKVVRFSSTDGGRTASDQVTVLDMFGEHQGQSHQISNLSFGPDTKLYVHMGDGFNPQTPLDLESFRGKILRVNTNGSAPIDNPFYNEDDGITARDYVYAYGFRNPFGGGWRLSDARHYEVENGPGVDRLARVDPGVSYGYDGSDESMFINALSNWNPATAPVNIAFIEPGVFDASGFPADRYGHAFVTLSGPTWLEGTTPTAKRIVEYVIDQNGNFVAELPPLVAYIGAGRGSACALAAGPDGLYFSDLYEDSGMNGPIAPGAQIIRIRYVGQVAFHADIRRGPSPLPVRFTDDSVVPNARGWEWDFGDGTRSTERNPVHVFTEPGTYNVRLSVTGVGAPVVTQANQYITVSPDLRIAFLGGNPTPTESDAAAIAALRADGYTVDYFKDDDADRPRGNDLARDRNLVIVASSISSPTILQEFRDVATPLMFWEQTLLLPPFEGLASGAAVVQGQNAVNIIDNAHPITYGMPAGSTVVYFPTGPMNIASGPFAPGLRVLAERDVVPGEVAMGVVEAGAPLLEGRVAPARRLFFFLDDITFLRVTPAGRQLFSRSVCWAAGLGAEFLVDPVDTWARSGEPVTLTAMSRGIGPVHYQWRRNGQPIANLTGPTLTIAHAGAGDRGVYDVIATSACNSVVSAPARLEVVCGGDYNRDGQVNSQDIFDFFACFFVEGCAEADFNADGIVNTQDFFDFITEFFTPCVR